MKDDKRKSEEKKSIDVLFDLIYESEQLSPKEIDASLREFGVDPQGIEVKGFALVQDLKRGINFDIAREKKRKFKVLKLRISQDKDPKQLRKLIQDLLMPSASETQIVFNRKLGEMSDSYLASLDNDKKLLDLWSDLEDCEEDS